MRSNAGVRGPDGERGQALIMVAAMIVGLVAILGLLVDGGLLFTERRRAQTAADAAALAASHDLARGRGTLAATNSALHYGALNGYNNNGTTNRVTVSIPPATGSFAGDSGFAHVTVEVLLKTFFIQIVRSEGSSVFAAATAGGVSGSRSYGVVILEPSACQALKVIDTAQVRSSGSMMVNSSCPGYAIDVAGGRIEAQWVGVTGGYSVTSGGSISPLPRTGVSPVPDPLADVPYPDISSLPTRHGAPGSPSALNITSDRTLDPGIYYGGIRIGGSRKATLRPGIYFIAGGGLEMAGSSRLEGSEVMIYNTGVAGGEDTTGDGMIFIGNSAVMSLSPPTSGPYAGLLLFQNRRSTKKLTVQSNEPQYPNGILYFAGAECLLQGIGAMQTGGLICRMVEVSQRRVLNADPQVGLLASQTEARLVQ